MNLTNNEKNARERLCLPLDNLYTLKEVEERIEELIPYVGLFKVGKESFTRFGTEIINVIHRYGSEVFLDLKYHDIPSTVKGAASAATELGVYMFNVHASGGEVMMKAAREGVENIVSKKNIRKPKIIAVTVLTSIDKSILNNDLNIRGSVEDQVLRLALLTRESGLDGIVCSAADLGAIRNLLPKDFLYVTPGIKGTNSSVGKDQKRVFTPGNAIKDGASILVAGRTITDYKIAAERQNAAIEVLKDMAKFI